MPPSSILITGASSGIGAALARAYARPGATLFLAGRDGCRLEAVASSCRAAGAEAQASILDVTDRESTGAWVARCEAARPLELVIANAGISGGTGGGGEADGQVRAIFAVNVDGVMNTVLPALGPMRARRSGQVAVMSSLAGFHGFPGAPAYCASKAAVRVWGESLRGWLAAEGVRVSVICPGYVETPMTAVNRFPMPLLMGVDQATRIIVAGLESDRGRIAFPWPTYAVVRTFSALPSAVADWIGRLLPLKD